MSNGILDLRKSEDEGSGDVPLTLFTDDWKKLSSEIQNPGSEVLENPFSSKGDWFICFPQFP